jgi:hypothetical protein
MYKMLYFFARLPTATASLMTPPLVGTCVSAISFTLGVSRRSASKAVRLIQPAHHTCSMWSIERLATRTVLVRWDDDHANPFALSELEHRHNVRSILD